MSKQGVNTKKAYTLSKADLGELVRKRRESFGWTQADLAIKSNLTQSYIGRVETGKQVGSPESLIVIALTLQLRPGELLDALASRTDMAVLEYPRVIALPPELSSESRLRLEDLMRLFVLAEKQMLLEQTLQLPAPSLNPIELTAQPEYVKSVADTRGSNNIDIQTSVKSTQQKDKQTKMSLRGKAKQDADRVAAELAEQQMRGLKSELETSAKEKQSRKAKPQKTPARTEPPESESGNTTGSGAAHVTNSRDKDSRGN